jgi:putative membrane protein
MSKYNSMRSKAVLASKGFVMGIADVIPGVSGGTIAFISGIYDDLLAAISSVKFRHVWSFFLLLSFFVNKPRFEQAKKELSEIHWNFLITLLSGIVLAILTMARLIPHLMQAYPFHTYSLFFGLILVSCSFPFREMKKTSTNFSILIAFALATFFAMASVASLSGSLNPAYVFASGAMAVCALILPGISGAYILVLLGQYSLILGALRSRELFTVSVFILGMLVGILSFVRVLKYLLNIHRSITMAALTGVMLGSLRKIWPGNFLGDVEASFSYVLIGCVFAVLGAIVVIVLDKSSKQLEGINS